MSRLLFLFAIVAVVYLLLKSFKKPNEKKCTRSEDMVRCARCGVHLPLSECIRSKEAYYCSAEHRDAG